MKISGHHLISSLIKLLDCHLVPLIDSGELKGKSETELGPLFEGMFFFSCIWSLGAVLYEMIALNPPFTAKDMKGLYNRVIKGVYPRLPA